MSETPRQETQTTQETAEQREAKMAAIARATNETLLKNASNVFLRKNGLMETDLNTPGMQGEEIVPFETFFGGASHEFFLQPHARELVPIFEQQMKEVRAIELLRKGALEGLVSEACKNPIIREGFDKCETFYKKYPRAMGDAARMWSEIKKMAEENPGAKLWLAKVQKIQQIGLDKLTAEHYVGSPEWQSEEFQKKLEEI